MANPQFLVIVVTLIGAAAFLFMWIRRDNGNEPEDCLPNALSDPLDGTSRP